MRNYSGHMDQRMFDFKEFYDTIADTLPEISTIAEVGLGDGVSSIFLAERLLNRSKEFTFHLIDSLAYGGTDQLCTIMGHLKAAKLLGDVELLPQDSLNASTRFPDNHFDFVFIDASHRYEPTKADIRLWYPKIRWGGILAGHDYHSTEPGTDVKRAVNELIPEELLSVEPTAKGYGVWWVKKERDKAICF